MPSSLNATKLTPPRVPLTDERTGLISREWYRFFENLFQLVGAGSNDVSLLDVQYAPPQVQLPSDTGGQTPADPLSTDLLPGLTELQKAVNGLESTPQPPLGTMAALQQANLPWVTFDTTPSPVPVDTGSLYWDGADGIKTLNLVMEDSGGVIQQIGEETYYRVKASDAITNGQVVMFTGSVGASGGLKGAPATGLTAEQADYVMGIATMDIAKNSWGYVTWFGIVRGIDTTGGAEAWTDGTVLYYDPAVAGGLTKTKPAMPNPIVLMAAVVNAASNGTLFVRPTYKDGTGMEVTTPPYTKTANFAITDGETWLINNKSGSSCTVTLPSASANPGRVLHFQNYQAQTLVSNASNVVPIAGGAAGTAILAAVAGDTATLASDGTNWIMTQYVPNNVLLLE